MTSEELEVLAKLVADELERRKAPPARAEPVRPLPAVGATEAIALGNLARAKHDPETMQRYAEAVPDALAREVVRDRAAAPASVAVKPGPVADPNPNFVDRSGWREAVPLRKWRS